MSLYKFLGTPVPAIAYTIFHQTQSGVSADEYMKTMKELHLRLADESREIGSGYEKYLGDVVARESQSLQNSLSHFLQTPIHSDSEEVRQMLVESFARFRDQVLENTPAGMQKSSEGRVFFASPKSSAGKKLVRNGKTYLGSLGLTTARGHPDIFESLFTLHGGLNLDTLEHLVRDRLGIYSETHGKHLKESGGYTFAAYNLAFEHGEFPTVGEHPRFVEMAFHFSKPDVKYAPFRNGMSKALEGLCTDIPLTHVTLWQRKLGLGQGREFTVRIITEQAKVLGDIIGWFSDYDEEKTVKDCITGRSSLIMKELLPIVERE